MPYPYSVVPERGSPVCFLHVASRVSWSPVLCSNRSLVITLCFYFSFLVTVNRLISHHNFVLAFTEHRLAFNLKLEA